MEKILKQKLDAGDQAAHWRNFYETAWEARAQFMQSLISEGESHPLRVIKRFQAKERLFELKLNQSGDAVFLPRSSGHKDIPLTPAGTPLFTVSSLFGERIAIPPYSYTELHLWIVDFIEKTGPYDALIELGCGFGRNLFEIFYSGGPRSVPYFGGELTKSGVNMAKKLASLEPSLDFNFFSFDFLDPNFSAIEREFKRPLIFSMHAIEQVTRVGRSFADALIKKFPNFVCMHFEPFGFQCKKLGPITDIHRNFFQQTKWNQDLFHVLKSLHEEKQIKITYFETEQFLPLDPANPSSLMIWEPSTLFLDCNSR